MPRSASRGDLLACSGGRARTSTPAVPRGRGHAACRGRGLHLDAGTEGGPNDIRTHDRAVGPPLVRDTHVRDAHVRRHPVARRLAPGSRHLPARRVSVRSVPPAPARGPLPGDALGQAFGRRHARAHGDAAVRGLPRRASPRSRRRGRARRSRRRRSRPAATRSRPPGGRAPRARRSRRRSARRPRARCTGGSPCRSTRASGGGSPPSGGPRARCSSTGTAPPTPSTSLPRTARPTGTTRCSAARPCPTCVRWSNATTARHPCRIGAFECRSPTWRRSCTRPASGRRIGRSRASAWRARPSRSRARAGRARWT